MNNKPIIIGGIIAALASGVALWYGLGDSRQKSVSEKEGTNVSAAPKSDTREAVLSKTVDLQDGQSFDLAITSVKKNIAGREVKMLGYNGSLPGPTFRIPEGAEVTINLKNEGDIATTLHAHGVRMDNAFDGVPGVTQQEIPVGGSFAYKLKFKDPGIFWYHPHVRTDYTLESGLYGNFIVTPKDTAYWPAANREVPLILDDIALDKNGLLPFDAKQADHALMGRFGNVMFVNGQTDYGLQAKQGEVVRLYLTNAANTRLFNFAIPGVKMKLVGADVGRYVNETWADEVLVAPGERRVVDVLFEKTGTYPMMHKTPGKEYALGRVSVQTEKASPDFTKEFSALRTNTAIVEEMRGLMDGYLTKTPDKNLRLSLDMNGAMQNMMKQEGGNMGGGHMMGNGMMMGGSEMGMSDDGDAFEWEDTMANMNAISNASMMKWKLVDDKTGKVSDGITDWKFTLGDKVKIRIFNDPKSMHPMQHPIHFHGQRLMVLSTNGVKNANPVWADTVLVAKGDTVDILLEASNPGTWVAHCHILEHAESGMMLSYTVEKPE